MRDVWRQLPLLLQLSGVMLCSKSLSGWRKIEMSTLDAHLCTPVTCSEKGPPHITICLRVARPLLSRTHPLCPRRSSNCAQASFTMPRRAFHHLTPVERWMMVRMAREQGMTRDAVAAVAAVVPCSKRTVTRILSLFRTTGDVVEQLGGGRAHAYSPRQMQRLHQLVLQNPHATAAGLVGLMGPNAPHISERTMRKYIRELNISRRREGTESFDTPRYIALRTTWAHQHRDDDILSWMFMDASTLMLRHTGDYVWAPK